MMIAYPTYLRLTCEFLSSYELDERDRFVTFRVWSQDFTVELSKLNDVFKFPKGHDAHIIFVKNEFLRELMGDWHAIYEARTCRESKCALMH